MYQHDASHTGNVAQTGLSAANIADLGQNWSFPSGGWITATPVVGNGMVYAGSWDGRMYALQQSDGQLVWSFDAGTTADDCGNTYGIDATAALADGVLYFGAANCEVFALDAATGGFLWSTQLADPGAGYHIWSSPVVFNGKVYVGLASHCDNPCVPGRLVALDVVSGGVLWSFNAAPDGSTGGGIWSSPAIDAELNLVIVTTGNYCTGVDTYSDSIVALDARTGLPAWMFKNISEDTSDLDFGASPVLFDAGGIPAAAAGSKNGHCYAVDRRTGFLLWDAAVTDGSAVGGIISSPAAANGLIYMGTSANGNQAGLVVALSQTNGQVVWQAFEPVQVLGPATVAGDILFIGRVDGALLALDAATGLELWEQRLGPLFSGVSISDDELFLGSADKSIHAFGLPVLRISTQALPSGTIGRSYSAMLSASGDPPLAWSPATGILPPGLSLSISGELTGVPTEAGIFTFGVQVSDATGLSVSASVTVNVAPRDSITVTAPGPADRWRHGSDYTVAWTATAGVSNVDIRVSHDGGQTWIIEASGVKASLGTARIKASKPKTDIAVAQVADSSDPTIFGQSGEFKIK